jgi:thiol-disulfide isomerase/thioredoxin
MSAARGILLGVVGVVVIGLGAAAALGMLGADRDEPAEVVTTNRSAVLDTTFEHFDGRVVRLGDWAGTPMVVNFWASWCPPCVAEMSAAFEPVHRQLGDDVAFIGLNLQDEPDSAARTVEQTGVTYELGRDPVGELFAAFGGIGMPTTVFVDASGQVVDTHTGALTRDQLEERIIRLFDVGAP